MASVKEANKTMKTESFQEKLDFLMIIIDRAPLGIMALDMKGRIRILNQMAAEILGIQGDIYNIRGSRLNHHLDDIGVLKGTLKKSLESGGTPINLEGINYREYFLTIRGRKIMNNYILTIPMPHRLSFSW